MTDAVEALQTTLAAEHAALHVYGVLGAATSASAEPVLFAAVSDAYDAHRDQRDLLSAAVVEEGGTPVAAEAAYELPALRGPDAVRRAADDLERACQASYAWLVAHTEGAQRRWAVTALQRSAVRALAFRGSPEIFPGLDEYTDR